MLLPVTMAVHTTTSSSHPLLFLYRGTANPSPAVISLPSSLRGVSLRSRATAAPPAETLSDDGIPDAPPVRDYTDIAVCFRARRFQNM
jgi:small subunit ribosomal protein S10